MCASKKKKREKETQQKEKHQTTNKRDATTDHRKTRYDNQVCYGPMRPTYGIHATHTWMRKPSMLRRRAPKGQHSKQKRTTNRHARQKACPQTQTATIYPPYLFLHRLRPPRDTRRKKKNQQKRKRYGAATDKGETMRRRTSEAHQPRGNNGMASKYVAMRGREPNGPATHTHTHINTTARCEKTETRARKNKV